MRSVAAMDDAVVIWDPPGGEVVAWSRAELDARTNRFANLMVELGIGPGDPVAWLGPDSPDVVAILFATEAIGAAAVAVNHRLAPPEVAYVLADSGASVCFVDGEYAHLVAAARRDCPDLAHVLAFGSAPDVAVSDARDRIDAASAAPPDVGAHPSGTAMIYTSGTTGRPKGVLRRARGGARAGGALVELFGFGPHDRYLPTGPLHHSGPQGFLFLAMGAGASVVVQRRFDAEDWLRIVDRHRVTASFSAPTPIRRITQLPDPVKARHDRSSMRCLVANAAPWSFALKQAYLADFPPDSLWEVYGSTELGVCTVLRPEDQLRKPGSCGTAAPGVEVALFDGHGRRITEPGIEGELHVRSGGVLLGYHGRDDAFADLQLGDGWFGVGDVATIDDEGYFSIRDRKKDMIITGGVNVYPAMVEAALDEHPAVRDVAVIGIPSDEWGEAVHALVVRDGPVTEAELAGFAHERLAGYEVPRSFEFVDEIPRTASGKILKRELRRPWWEGRDRRI